MGDVLAPIRRLLRKSSAFFHRERWEQEMDEEMQYHIAMQEQRNREAGMPPTEARDTALRRFGNPASLRERGRDAWGWSLIEDLIHDLRVAGRGMRRNPGYAVLAATTLAIAIGACTAVFTVAYSVLLGRLPYSDPDRLVLIFEDRAKSGFPKSDTSPANFRHLQSGTKSFEGMALFHPNGTTLTDSGEPERVTGVRVSGNFFHVLGVNAAYGRVFESVDDHPGNDSVVIISHELWQRRYGADPAIIGRKIRLSEQPYTVLGVMPPRFQFLYPEAQFWTPLGFSDRTWARRDLRYLHVIARLRDGVAVEHAQAELNAISPEFERVEPDINRDFHTIAVPLRQELTGDVRSRVLLLGAAVVLVLLIGCTNVAHLILSRSVRRSSEFVVRLSLGAGRSRLVRQLLAESLVLAIAGGVLGLVLGSWCLRVLQFLVPPTMSGFVSVETNGGVIALAFVLALLACVLSGLLPALRIAAVNWHEAIRQGSSRVVGGVRQEYVRGLLVVTEVALAVVLVVGASLLGRTLLEVLRVDPGFDPDGVLTAVTIPPTASQGFEARNAFIDETLRRVKSLRGVTHAAYMSAAPFTWKGGRLKFDVEGQLSEHDQGALNRQVTPDYFRTLQIPLRSGREFTPHDRSGSELVAIVNEALARRYLQGRSAVGSRIRVNGPGFTDGWMRVVGVVGDVKEMGLLRPAHPMIYLPHSQTRADFNDPFQLAVRTNGDAMALAPVVRGELRTAWPAMPISNMRPLSAIVDLEMADRGPMTVLAGGLASVALTLAAIGIYGLLAFSIAQRLPEIGIRLALGAQSLDVFRSVVGKGLGLAAWGTAAGLALSLLLVQLMRGVLYGIKPLDPAAFILAPATVILIALLACLLPARSALRVDPAQALRSE